jgi:alpha-L-rhamnosidase
MNGVHLNRDRHLDPAPSSYDKRIYYNSFDVTDAVVKYNSSRQALGFVVGNGWFNLLPMKFWGQRNLRESMTVGTPRVRCILVVEYRDENLKPLIVTTRTFGNNGAEWMTAESGLLRNDLYLGNFVDLDRSRWLVGWSKVGFNSPLIEWQPVVTCPPPSEQRWLPILEPQPIPPIRSRPPHQLKALSTTIVDTDLVLDMGLNTAAVVRVEIHVPHDWVCSAQLIELKFGEILFPNGTVNGYTSVA